MSRSDVSRSDVNRDDNSDDVSRNDSSKNVDCSVAEVKSNIEGDDCDALILTDSLAVQFTERVLLLAVNRAYERVGEKVSSMSLKLILELFIYYVRSFERRDYLLYVRSFERKVWSDAFDSYNKETIADMVVI